MSRWFSRGLLQALALAMSAPVPAAVEVAFIQPQNFHDASTRFASVAGRDRVMTMLAQHFAQLGVRYLEPTQHLTLDILDVDLAGRCEPGPGSILDIRVLRSITWPRIRLRYTLRRDDQVVDTAVETISDRNYLEHGDGYFDGDPLHYEKAMLTRWFRGRFGAGYAGRQ